MAGPADLFRLDGTNALVTGASAGLGLHFARVLHAAGARVALTARRAGRIAAEAAALGPGACAVPLDVTDAGAIAPAFDAAEAALGGPVTLLVNNAGVGLTRRLAETSDADWDGAFAVNLRAAFLMCREAAGRMAAAGGGAIVNVASVLAIRVTPRAAAYAASKAGLDQLTRVLAVELARDNIRVNALAPGYVETDMTRETLTGEAGRRMLARIPQRRFGAPEDLTGPLLLLASRAGAHVTGATLVVDGGHSVGGL